MLILPLTPGTRVSRDQDQFPVIFSSFCSTIIVIIFYFIYAYRYTMFLVFYDSDSYWSSVHQSFAKTFFYCKTDCGLRFRPRFGGLSVFWQDLSPLLCTYRDFFAFRPLPWPRVSSWPTTAPPSSTLSCLPTTTLFPPGVTRPGRVPLHTQNKIPGDFPWQLYCVYRIFSKSLLRA